ncbi:TonB-dependent receptor [Sphingomonas oligophenolica]|uniref:TonB-dependent receptor n=1 Tax=Sphingomonas oligophenolica TaxID=301154 RepID=A0ABU9Y957_9SPHN
MTRSGLAVTASALALIASGAHAQGASAAALAAKQQQAADDTGGTENDIIVTAERRAQRLDKVPLSISAISGDKLEEQQIPRVQELVTQVPGVSLTQNRLGSYKIAIRGIGGSAGDNIGANLKVAVFVDDIYLARQGAMDPTFFNLERIEILRGPQGTLYGKNAVAGAINIYTRLPSDQLDMRAAVDVGNYGTINSRVLLSGPLGGDLSGSIVAGQNYHSGYGKNVATGNDITGGKAWFGRATLRWHPGDWDVILSGDYEKDPDQPARGFYLAGTGYSPLGRGPYLGPAGFHDVSNDYDDVGSLELAGGSVRAIHRGRDLTFTSITGYRWSDRYFQADIDNTDSRVSHFDFRDRQRQYSGSFSEELRLSSTEDGSATLDGKLFWNLGAYFFSEHGSTVETTDVVLGVNREQTLTTRLGTRNFAVYGQGTYNLTDALHLTAGLRYNWERKHVVHSAAGVPLLTNEPYTDIPITRSWDNLSPKLTLDYSVTQNTMVYATYSRGFLSGAINSGPATAILAATEAANPEIDDNFEIGLKGKWLDGRLHAGIAGYYIKYKDLQVQVANQAGQAVTRNAARATSKGFEVEAGFEPLDALRFDLSYAHTNARYDRYCAGSTDGLLTGAACTSSGGTDKARQRLEYYSPDTIHAGAEIRLPVGDDWRFTVRGDWTYNSHSTFPGFYQAGYSLFNAGARLETTDGRWAMGLFGRNLGDKEYVVGCGNFGATTNGGACNIGDPRTYGVTITWRNR